MQNGITQEKKDKLQKLITQYNGLKAIESHQVYDVLIKILKLIQKDKDEDLLNHLLKSEVDLDIRRIALQQKQLTLNDIKSDLVLSKINPNLLNIQPLGDKIGESIIDQIVVRQFASLADKIIFFNHFANLHRKELDKSLKHLLVLSHMADKGFYNHLEKLVLNLDDVQLFHEKYSYNPYQGKNELLTEAISHLLNIVIKSEVRSVDGISYMKDLINKYRSIIQYNNICDPQVKGVHHPVFYLVEARMWDELYNWVEKDLGILMMADSKSPLITTILTFAHGYVKGKEHDNLRRLQEKAIVSYIEGEMYKMLPIEHKVVEPQIGLFIGYLEYVNASSSKENEIFIKTTRSYYKELIEYFIKIDHDSKHYSFLKAKIDGSLLPESEVKGMISFWSLILRSPELVGSPIVVSNEQLAVLPKDELIVDLYSGVIVKDKVSERAPRILDEISQLFNDDTTYNIPNDKSTILDKMDCYQPKEFQPIDQLKIGKDNLITRMFNDNLKIFHSNLFDYKAEVTNKIYSTIIAGINSPAFNLTDFIINNPETFDIICMMGCERLLDAIENRIKLDKKLEISSDENLEMDDFQGTTKVNSTKILKILVPSAITTMWLGHIDNSNEIVAEKFIKTADTLNTIIRRVGRYIGEPAVLLNTEYNDISHCRTAYLTCDLQGVNIHTTSSLNLQFIDGKFQFKGGGAAIDYVRLYNFYSGFLAKKLYLEKNFGYEELFETGEAEEVKKSFESNGIFGKVSSLLPNVQLLHKAVNSSVSIINKAKDVVQSIVIKPKMKVNEQNVAKGINLCLLYSGNKNNQFKIEKDEIDKNLSQMFNLFDRLDRKSYIFEEINDATSELWDSIRLTGSERTKLITDFLLGNGYLNENEITPFVTRAIKAGLMEREFDGVNMWLDYSLKRFSSQKLNKEISSIGVLDITNGEQVMVVHDALLIATMLNMPEGVKVILSKYRNFLLLYRNPEFFSKYTTFPFAIVREHSKSKMMELENFRESLNEVAVVLLGNGYPIELVEKCDDLKASSFIQSITGEQVKYSIKRLALNYSEALPIPFIRQFKDTLGGIVEVNFYLELYNKSFNFIYGKLTDNKIDISNFCHIFSSILQPPDFLKRLKSVTFLTGLKFNFNVKDDGVRLMMEAKNIALIIRNMDDEVVKNFTVRWNAFMMDKIMDFPEICQYVDEELSGKEMKKVDQVNDINEVDFSTYIYSKYQKKDPAVILYKMEQDNSIKVLAHVSAVVITGTFIYFNNPELRYTLITVIPTIYSGLSLAGSISSSVISSTVHSLVGSIQDMSYTALYLLLAGATIYGGYKLYQSINSDKVVKLDLEMLEDLVGKFKEPQRTFQAKTSRANVYNEISKIFKEFTGQELMRIEVFFSLMNRFGISSAEIDNAIYNLKSTTQNCDLNDNFLTIAYVMSLATMYLNVQKIKHIVEKVDDNLKQKCQTLLHEILVGNVINVEFEMINKGLDKFYSEELNKLVKDGLPIIIQHYNPKKSYQYQYIWQNTTDGLVSEKVLEKIEETKDNLNVNPFLKFLLVLSKEMRCAIDKKIANINYLSLD